MEAVKECTIGVNYQHSVLNVTVILTL